MSEFAEKKRKLLVVDDDKTTRELYGIYFSAVLGLADEEVTIASSVAEAERILQTGVITHVITDGLYGGWIEVLKLATQANIPRENQAVASSDGRIVFEVPTGVEFVAATVVDVMPLVQKFLRGGADSAQSAA